MNKHRTLSSALDLTPEKLAFIKGDVESQPTDDAIAQHTTEETIDGPAIQRLEKPKASAKPSKQSANNATRQTDQVMKKARNTRASAVPVPPTEDYRVPITTRLEARTADALRRAYLERKLDRQDLATKQEIIEAALQNWLGEHGYLN